MNVRDPETESPPTADALDAWLADDTVVAELADEEPPASSASSWIGLDPVSAWLLRLSLALIIVVLVTSAAMIIYFMTAEKAPRTAVERDIAAAEIAVRERPSDFVGWRSLAYAYQRAGRYDDALKTIRDGRTSTEINALLLPEADILRAAGRHTEAVGVYDDAVVALSREASASAAARAAQGVAMADPSSALVLAYYGRGLSHKALGENTAAIRDVLKALELSPGQANMSVTLGDLYSATNQDDLAKAAYSEALRYVPDYAEALAGLKRIEEGK